VTLSLCSIIPEHSLDELISPSHTVIMDVTTASKCFAELGNPHRLEAFRLLVRAGHDGLTVGQVQQHLGIPKSTLSHHCLHLISVGLVEQRREGRTIRCFANCDLTQDLARFLIDQCCLGVEMVETGDAEIA
jgi:ArsR family transcriptional regulator